MTPSELRTYLRQRGQASLVDLVARFDTDPEVVRDVLGYWQRKGRIQETAAGCGKSCGNCNNGPVVFYQWQE